MIIGFLSFRIKSLKLKFKIQLRVINEKEVIISWIPIQYTNGVIDLNYLCNEHLFYSILN